MRIHGIHSQGIRPVGSDRYLALHAGYQQLTARSLEDAHGLLCVFEALLYPAPDLEALAVWRRSADQPAKAGLGISLGDQAYRVAIDLERGAAVLGRFNAEEDRYERVASSSSGVRDELIRHGLALPDDFRTLLVLDGSFDVEGASETTTVTRTPQTASDPETQESLVDREEFERQRDAERARAQTRVRLLASARSRLQQLREEEAELCRSTGALSDISQLDADVEERIEEFRDRGVRRQSELDAVEALRRGFLKERGQLRSVPATQTAGIWLGVALAAVGGLAGALVSSAFYWLAIVGLLTALLGFGISHNARRKLGRIEAQLAALRSREAAIERRYEADTAPVRSALRVLELDSIDELPYRLAEYRRQSGQLEAVRRDLAEASAAYPEGSDQEIAELQRRLRTGDFELPKPPVAPAPQPGEEPAATDAGPTGADVLENLLAAAQRMSNFGRLGLENRLVATAQVYIRAFTGNAFSGLRRDGVEWFLLRKENSDAQALSEIEPVDLREIGAALQLSLVEALASEQRMPLFVGPQFDSAADEFKSTLARALRRLASGVQVLHCTSLEQPWSEFANASQLLNE